MPDPDPASCYFLKNRKTAIPYGAAVVLVFPLFQAHEPANEPVVISVFLDNKVADDTANG
jgi:hypothetical protein